MSAVEEDVITTPHGTDDSGAVVEEVTVEASRLPNFGLLAVLAIAGAAIYFATTEEDSDDEDEG